MTKEELDNLKIGEHFTIGNHKFEIVQENCCDNCFFNNDGCGVLYFYDLRPECCSLKRKDKKNVIFKEVE